MKKISAFTLIELLIVLAIIGILSTISVPIFKRVNESSRKIDCANKIRQISTAAINYSTEEHTIGNVELMDYIPPADNFYSSIGPYLGMESTTYTNEQTALNTLLLHKMVSCISALKLNNKKNMLTYGRNGVVAPQTNYINIASIQIPSKTALLGDGIYTGNSWKDTINGDHKDNDFIHQRLGINIGFFDGHVSYVPQGFYPTSIDGTGKVGDGPYKGIVFWSGGE